MEMRKKFAIEIEKHMLRNEKIVLINADLTATAGLADVCKKFSNRTINVGVAEQNMASIAAGMSSQGFIPFIFSFTPFVTRRICDQIAVSICYAKQNVKIIGLDPGISAELNGGTHMSVEDIGVLRSIPNIIIFEPVDNIQLEKALPQIIAHNGPVYVRMFRKEIANVFDENYEFNLLKSSKIKAGTDVSVFCSGIMVEETLKANEELTALGIAAEIINLHTIKPTDKKAIVESAQKTGAVVTVENHNIIGGLRSAVAEVLIENCPVPLKSVGIPDVFGEVGKMPYLKQIFKMTAHDIVKSVQDVIKIKGVL